jgi:hypothetical protein
MATFFFINARVGLHRDLIEKQNRDGEYHRLTLLTADEWKKMTSSIKTSN